MHYFSLFFLKRKERKRVGVIKYNRAREENWTFQSNPRRLSQQQHYRI
jgi:hypothetical protein